MDKLMKAIAEIDAGVCGFRSLATARSEDSQHVVFEVGSDCENNRRLARLLKLSYQDAAPAAMIGASNHFEVAIATATMLFGLSSSAALATVVAVLIEVPVRLMLVKICLKTQGWFKHA